MRQPSGLSPWLRAGVGICLAFTACRMVRLEGWDDAFYLAQLTSVIGDRDLTLHDDLLAVPNTLSTRYKTVMLTAPSGALLSTFSIGPAVLHSLYLTPVVLRTSDLSGAFRRLYALASVGCLALLALALRELLRVYGAAGLRADLAVVVAILGSPLAIYGTRTYANAHLLSALFATLFLLASRVWTLRGGMLAAWIAGLVAGFLVILRWQDAVFLLVGVPGLIVAVRERRWQALREILVAALAAGLPVGVQLAAFRVQFGTYLTIPQGTAFMQWTRPPIWDLLTSGYHGVLPWAPALAVGTAALPLLRSNATVRRTGLLIGAGLAVSAVVYVSASAWDWWAGDSYGPRRLLALVPLVAAGFSALLGRLSRWGASLLVAGVLGWSVFTTSAFLSGWDDLGWLVTGRLSRGNPNPATRYENLSWRDSWGPAHALKPGFTLSDRPRNGDRVAGLLLVGIVTLGAAGLWRALVRRREARVVAAGLLTGWTVVWWVLVSLAPSNAPTDERWRRLLRREDVDTSDLRPSTRAAAAAVRALVLLRSGRGSEAEAHLAAANASGYVMPIGREELEALAAGPD